MIAGCGVDAVSVNRCRKLSQHCLERTFSSDEVKYANSIADEDKRAEFIASRFAAKEAFAKATGTGFGENASPHEISVDKDKAGKPFLVFSGKTAEALSDKNVFLSLTHEKEIAVAVVILEYK